MGEGSLIVKLALVNVLVAGGCALGTFSQDDGYSLRLGDSRRGLSKNTAVPPKPNVIIFFADDFGFGDLASYGHPTQEFGVIDALAESGVRFTQWYAAESVCTPSRMSLMTGRMPTRMGMGHTVFGPASSNALPTTDPTIAEMLKPLGYVTGMAGKWHLGLNKLTRSDGLHLPFYRGFDEVGHILPFSNHWACDESGRHSPKPGLDFATDKQRNSTCFLYHNTTLVQQPIDHTNLTETLVADAERFIANAVSAGKPFLWYMPFPQCHVSMFTNFKWTNTSRNGIFGDQIRAMDWAVGRVMAAVEAAGVTNNTIVFFSSDHGPHVELCLEGGTAAGLRGGKGDSSWEGGLRVPGIVAWPGVIPGGRVESAVVSTMDIFATVIDLAGGDMPHGRINDGRSLVPLLLGSNSTSPHAALFHYCGDTLMAVRYKQYKLRYYTEELPFDNYSTVHCTNGWAHGEFFQSGWSCHNSPSKTNNPPELLDVESDPAERMPLLSSDTWLAHLADERATRSANSPLWQLRYFADIDALPRCDNKGTNITLQTGIAYGGYSGTSLPFNTPSGELVNTCRSRCCNDSDCVAFTLQTSSLNKGMPIGSCTVGKPCCWLIDKNGLSHSSLRPNATSAVVRGGPTPPSPGPPSSGPYADVLKEIARLVAEHLATMSRETLPGDARAKLGPCCDSQTSGGAEICTCNYPSKLPP